MCFSSTCDLCYLGTLEQIFVSIFVPPSPPLATAQTQLSVLQKAPSPRLLELQGFPHRCEPGGIGICDIFKESLI